MNTDLEAIFHVMDVQRHAKGFLSISETMALSEKGNVLLDPFSILISKAVTIGSGNLFYPGVVIEAQSGCKLEIGDENTFYSQSNFLAGPGRLTIGNRNQFGEGGVSIKSNGNDTNIVIGNHGRFVNGVQVFGNTILGDGSQLIGGQLTIQDCQLEGGESYSFNDPDYRGAVIKGFGVARNLVIGKGKVLNGQGAFNQQNVQDQSFYHPKKEK